MGFSDNLRQGTIELLLKNLKTESDPKKIERGVKALMKYGLTQEDIGKRLSEVEEVQESTQSPSDKGYKKGTLIQGNTCTFWPALTKYELKKVLPYFQKECLGRRCGVMCVGQSAWSQANQTGLLKVMIVLG